MTDHYKTIEQALKLGLAMYPNELATARIYFEDAFSALRELQAQPAQRAQKPVAAQHRFRHPQKTMPDWSVWQICTPADRPAHTIDSMGYQVEYRPLYTGPSVELVQQARDALTQVHGDFHLMPGRVGPQEAFLMAREAIAALNKWLEVNP